MKSLFYFIGMLSALSVCSQTFTRTAAFQGASVPKAAAGGGGAAFSDNFDRADNDSLGANWTEADPDVDIFSNTARFADGSFADMFDLYTGTACSTVNQYVQVKIMVDAAYFQIPMRYTSSGVEFYFFEFSNTTVDWYHTTGVGGTDTQINAVAGSISIGANQILSITLTGTGDATTVRIWTDATSGSLPSAAGTWNGDSTPQVTFTDNPANPVDAGNYVGIGGVQSAANTLRIDDFFGGDIP